MAKTTLMAAVSQEGAIDLAKAWIGPDPMVSQFMYVRAIQYSAMRGLVYLRELDADAFIDKTYQEELAKSRIQGVTPLWGVVVDGMAMKDYLKDTANDLDAFLKLENKSEEVYKALSPYIEKYEEKDLCPTLRGKNRVRPNLSTFP